MDHVVLFFVWYMAYSTSEIEQIYKVFGDTELLIQLVPYHWVMMSILNLQVKTFTIIFLK